MKKGIYFALVAASISGISIFYNKLAITNGLDPLVFNIYKNGGAAILITLLLLKSRNYDLLSISKEKWLKLFLIGLVGGSLPFLLFFTGLQSVSATGANLIHKTLFIWVAGLSVVLLRERLNLWQIAGYLLVVVSNFFIGGFNGFAWSFGEGLILAATLFWSAENILAKFLMKDLNFGVVAWGRTAIGTLILIFIAVLQNKSGLILSVKTGQLLPLAGSIVLLSAYVISWYKALKSAPAASVTAILVLATPITNALTAIFINGDFPKTQIPNIFLTVSGVFLIIHYFRKSGKKTVIHGY